MNIDAVLACMDLAGRSGATEFNFGYAREGVPVDQAGWWAYAAYRGARVIVEERRSPGEAAMAPRRATPVRRYLQMQPKDHSRVRPPEPMPLAAHRQEVDTRL
jgi:hypothetical protein